MPTLTDGETCTKDNLCLETIGRPKLRKKKRASALVKDVCKISIKTDKTDCDVSEGS